MVVVHARLEDGHATREPVRSWAPR